MDWYENFVGAVKGFFKREPIPTREEQQDALRQTHDYEVFTQFCTRQILNSKQSPRQELRNYVNEELRLHSDENMQLTAAQNRAYMDITKELDKIYSENEDATDAEVRMALAQRFLPAEEFQQIQEAQKAFERERQQEQAPEYTEDGVEVEHEQVSLGAKNRLGQSGTLVRSDVERDIPVQPRALPNKGIDIA